MIVQGRSYGKSPRVRAEPLLGQSCLQVTAAGLRGRYNVRVSRLPQVAHSSKKRPKHHIYALETTGLLLIAVMLLIVTLIRYWHNINWSAR